MRNGWRIAILNVVFVFALSSWAHAETFEIDAVHSSIGFKIRHLVSTTRGSFTGFSGTIEYNAADITASTVTVTIDAASINTHNTVRDDHLRGPDFFDVENHPEILFVGKRIEGDKLIGDLTMHGVTKEVALDYEFHGTMADHKGVTRMGASATAVLNRKDFGMIYNKVLDHGGLLLGEKVTIEIEIEAIKKSS